jgi:hypothetical protein
MKSIKYILSLMLVFLVFTFSTFACEMNFEIVKGGKANYSKNDEIVVKLKVEKTHRNCKKSIEETEIKTNGAEITSATKWNQVSPGVWERKLKIKITNPKSGKATINAERTCDKDGGNATLTLTVK